MLSNQSSLCQRDSEIKMKTNPALIEEQAKAEDTQAKKGKETDEKLDSSPCCAALRRRCIAIYNRRTALRKALEVLNKFTVELENENLETKKMYKEEKVRAELEHETRVIESAVRVDLENEVSRLKSELASLQEKRGLNDEDTNGEVILLQARVSEGETKMEQLTKLLDEERKRRKIRKKKTKAQINVLKELLEREMKSGALEKKNAEAEINRLSYLLEQIESEAFKKLRTEIEDKEDAEALKWNRKAEEEIRGSDTERSPAEECCFGLEASMAEVSKLSADLIVEKPKNEEALRRLESEKDKKKQAEQVLKEIEQQRKRKKIGEEDQLNQLELSQRLEASRNDIKKNMMALEKLLELGKMKIRNSEIDIKFEKMRNNLIEGEMLYWKMRLNVLDKKFSHRCEGIEAPAKFTNSSELHNLNSEGILPGTGSEYESAMYSIGTSLGDEPMVVGSPEKHALAVNDDLAMIENNVGNSICGQMKVQSLNSESHGGIEVFGREPGDSSKKAT